MAKMTTEEFIAKAREIHGDKYDYSKVEYVNGKTKVCIICPEHGPFWQSPQHHILRKQGCKKCSSPNSDLTTEEFIKKAKEIHGDKYDYSLTIFSTMSKKVKIICPVHGEFEQEAHVHLEGHGCRKCAAIEHSQKRRTGTEEFIKKAREVHGDKYDYSQVNYINSNTKVCIICPEHGPFWQVPGSHLAGCSCPICAKEIRSKTRKAKRISYDEAKALIGTFKLKDQGEFYKIYDETLKPLQIPKTPQTAYKDEGWVSWPVFLGNDRKSADYLPYEEAKKYVNQLGLTSVKEWRNLCKEEKIPFNIPYFPESTYSGKEWTGYDEWLGESYKNRYREFCSYEEAKQIMKGFALQSVDEFYDLIKQGKLPYNIPTNPQHKYSDEWECWQVFLGYGGGYRKNYKFNLLQEFENEYAFREFLANNDINILQVILRNVEPKYEPLKKDIERALANAESMNPIRALEEKYSSSNGDDEEPIDNESTTREEPIQNTPDLDDDDAMSEFINTMSGNNEREEKEEPTIEEITRNREEELKVINRIEHMLTPEDREYIMNKFLNDKRRDWMANREQNK